MVSVTAAWCWYPFKRFRGVLVAGSLCLCVQRQLFLWMAGNMASCPKGSKNGIKKHAKVSKIEVLGGLGPPWVTMWGPRGVGVTFLTFFNGFWCHFGDPFGRQFCRFSHSGGERCTR